MHNVWTEWKGTPSGVDLARVVLHAEFNNLAFQLDNLNLINTVHNIPVSLLSNTRIKKRHRSQDTSQGITSEWEITGKLDMLFTPTIHKRATR